MEKLGLQILSNKYENFDIKYKLKVFQSLLFIFWWILNLAKWVLHSLIEIDMYYMLKNITHGKTK